jgi:D-glycero-alpha-D-manno-heptose-7-phosphate kinase
MVTKRQLAMKAIDIEQNVIKENVGSQDQVAATFGGFNKIEFGGPKEFYVYPITIGTEKTEHLQQCLMLYFTGFSRNASDVAGEQIRITPSKKIELKLMAEMVDEAIGILNGKAEGFRDFGKLLHETWKIKRGLTNLISNDILDEMYETAIRAGALGGKLLGAGGGGFLLLFALPEDQPKVREAMKRLLYVPFRLESLGSQTIMYSIQDF